MLGQKAILARVIAATICVSVFAASDVAYACRGGRGPYVPVATLEQAHNLKPTEISFIGKIVEKAPVMKFEVVQRIQGDVPDVVMVNLWCMQLLWGEIGDTVPVIAVRPEPTGPLFGVGGGYDRAPSGWPKKP